MTSCFDKIVNNTYVEHNITIPYPVLNNDLLLKYFSFERNFEPLSYVDLNFVIKIIIKRTVIVQLYCADTVPKFLVFIKKLKKIKCYRYYRYGTVVPVYITSSIFFNSTDIFTYVQ